MQPSTQAAYPVHLHVIFDSALLAALDAYRRDAEGLPSRSEVIRQAVRALGSKPMKSRGGSGR